MEAKEQTLNPWVSMWTKPRATIQQIIDEDPERLVIVMAAISGFSEALNRASMRGLGDEVEWPFILLIAAIVGSIARIILLYIGGALTRWTGTWIGGRATSQNIRAAMAWSNVPIVWGLILWIPGLALFGQELFTTEIPTISASSSLIFAYQGFAVINMTIAVWALIIFTKCLGQVQGFSAWKALGNVILAVLVMTIPILIIGIGIIGLTR